MALSAEQQKRLDEIREREQAATGEPWSLYGTGPFEVFSEPDSGTGEHVTHGSPREADAEFIAAARADVPWLLELVDSLQQQVAETEWANMLTPQECQNKQHANWWVDSEHHHLCPWCRIAELEGVADGIEERVRQAFAETDEQGASLDGMTVEQLTDMVMQRIRGGDPHGA